MADIDQYYLATMNGIAALIAHDRASYPEIVNHLEATLVDRYFCNFSVFQSLPDNWAIDQIFPIMPVHRLDEFGENWRLKPGIAPRTIGHRRAQTEAR